jgi:hypothetical protein
MYDCGCSSINFRDTTLESDSAKGELQMTKLEVMDALQGRQPDQELRWMFALGSNLTVPARGYFPVEGKHGSISHLMGFNELQHQVYGRIRQFGRDEDWTLDSFLAGLLQKADFYGISGDLGWAIKSAIASIN